MAAGGKKAFLRVARERFYQTTRNDSEKWEKMAGLWGKKVFNSMFQAFLMGIVGRLTVFGGGGQESFL
jgi:hypothetical protein